MEQPSLDVLIAHAAVARTEAREAEEAFLAAQEARDVAQDKRRATQFALDTELERRISALDPTSGTS